MWQLGPVVRGLRGHRAAAALVVVQLGAGLAITVLSVLIGDYFMARNAMRMGQLPDTLSFVEIQQRARGDVSALLAEIRETPTCAGATVVSGLPLHALERDTDDVRSAASSTEAYDLVAGDGFIAASGLQLRAGRDFVPGDLTMRGETAAIVTTALAQALWPGSDPLGARFHSRSHGPTIVVGVTAPVRSYLLGDSPLGAVYARVNPTAHVVVLARTASDRVDAFRTALRERAATAARHVDVYDAASYVRSRFGSNRSVFAILAAIVGAIVVVIVIGSMGLTYFLVSQRTREIGVRRALGATRADVVRFFVAENLILTAAGALLGLGVIVLVLPKVFYEQEGFALNWPLVTLSVSAVLALNLLATLIPARRAAAVPPVVASRSS